jgi:hypothetical protein
VSTRDGMISKVEKRGRKPMWEEIVDKVFPDFRPNL